MNDQFKSELQLQSACFQWAWNTHPETRRLLAHIPNGSSRNKVEAVQLKASGVVAGWPDLMLVWKGRVHAFELKLPHGTVSPEQREIHRLFAAQGITVHI